LPRGDNVTAADRIPSNEKESSKGAGACPRSYSLEKELAAVGCQSWGRTSHAKVSSRRGDVLSRSRADEKEQFQWLLHRSDVPAAIDENEIAESLHAESVVGGA